MDNFQVLVDSDAFVGWLLPKDAHFQQASAIFGQLAKQQAHLVTTSWVKAETATVLSHKAGQGLARAFLEKMKRLHFPTIHITEELQSAATDLFIAQEQRGTSMTDCGNVVVMKRLGIPMIFSFDRIYTKQFGLETAA